jgi:hypothetical protein
MQTPGVIHMSYLIGKQYGSWTVRMREFNHSKDSVLFLCVCSCGRAEEIELKKLRRERGKHCKHPVQVEPDNKITFI